MNDILAYHIVWTTYGTWLPGDIRGWVKKRIWGIQEPDPKTEQSARDGMAEPPVLLTPEQQAIVRETILKHCSIRGWHIHASNVRTNHVHLVVTADCNWEVVRDQLKAWCSRRLSDAAGLSKSVATKAGRRHWFTEGGNAEYIDSEDYLANAIIYVNERQ
jgi:REP element-mobilizing transposase RayT